VPLDRSGDRRGRAGGGTDELLDVLSLDAHPGPDRRIEYRLGAVERHHPFGELDGQITRLHAERAFEVELGPLTGQREVEFFDAVRSWRLPFPAYDVRDDTPVDLHLRHDRGRRAARAAAAPSRPRRVPGLGRRRETRDVQTTVRAPDECDARPLERDGAELDAAAEKRAKLEIDPTGLEREERCGAELWVFGDLELMQLDRRQREQRDGQRLEL